MGEEIRELFKWQIFAIFLLGLNFNESDVKINVITKSQSKEEK